MAIKLPSKKATTKTAPNAILIKKQESILVKEIMFIEKNMATYRAERKASWKSFKSKMETDIHKIKQSIQDLTQPLG